MANLGLKFEWDPQKANQNRQKHHVSFEEASTVFADPLAATTNDPDHSDAEERYITIGYSKRRRLLIISHTERGGQIRLISARELTSTEREAYEEES